MKNAMEISQHTRENTCTEAKQRLAPFYLPCGTSTYNAITTTLDRIIFLGMAAPMAATYMPTAQMPLMKGIRAELVQALDEDHSLFELSLMLGNEVVKDLEKVLGKVPIHKTMESFKHGPPLLRMISLLHYINVKLLRSIIAGTLAYDLVNDKNLREKCQYNDREAPGTYVVSLSIKGRYGKFLNMRELRELAGLVTDYAEKAGIWVKNKGWDDQNPTHVAAWKFIEEVDNKCSRASPLRVPLFAPREGAIDKLKELAKMFDRRVNLALDVQNSYETYHVQAPVMVGCTADTIANRTVAHEPQFVKDSPLTPISTSLQSTTKTWALTLSLLSYMRLEPRVFHVAALPFFNPSDLPLTEILLTTLARSFVWQDGFNVIQGGGQHDYKAADRGYEEKRIVCQARDFLKDNLERTLNRIQELRNKISILKNLDRIDLDALDAEINKLQAQNNKLHMHVSDFEKTKAEFIQKYTGLEETVERQDEALQQWKGWNDLLDML